MFIVNSGWGEYGVSLALTTSGGFHSKSQVPGLQVSSILSAPRPSQEKMPGGNMQHPLFFDVLHFFSQTSYIHVHHHIKLPKTTLHKP